MNNSNLIEITKSFWENTYNQNINKMIGVCYRYTANRQIAEDLAHDAFILAYEKVESFEGKGPFEAWMRRIVVNLCLQYLRERYKKKYLNDWILNETYTLETHDENPNKENPDFTEAELLEAINQLPEHHKLVFNLYVIDKFTHAQIGKELGISEGTSKSHLARARKKIKDMLNEKLDSDKRQKKKLAFILFFWNIDGIYKKRFENFEIRNQNEMFFDSLKYQTFSPTSFKRPVPFLSNNLSFGIVISSIAFLSLFFLQKTQNTDLFETKTEKFDNHQKANISNINPENTATISEKPIMSTENKNLIKKPENMKNLKAIGALLLTGTSLAMPLKGQNQVKIKPKIALQKEEKPNVALNPQSDNNLTININAPNEQGENSTTTINIDEKSNFEKDIKVDMTGTFFAEKLYWSAQNRELYFVGKSTVSFGKNRYVGSGSSSFLGKVHFLVVDGKPVSLDESKKTYINLSEKKYNITQLSIKRAIEKYGDVGKKGAIEISLVE